MEQNGIFNMDEKAYRSLNRLNYSSMKHLLKSPAHYLASLSAPPESSKAMDFGSGFHCMCLEPEQFNARYVVADCDRRTIKGKQLALEIEMVQKKKIVSLDDYDRMKKMANNIKKHGVAGKLLSGGEAESVLLFDLQASNENTVKCKAKVDYMFGDVLVDVKTTQDASTESFSKTLENFGYFMQGSFYSRGVEILSGKKPDFIFIAVESEAPYGVNVIRLSDNHYSVGYRKMHEAIDIYDRATVLNEFPCYPEMINDSIMSKWLK